MFVSDAKFDAAHSAFRIPFPVRDDVVLAALRTRIANREFPIFLWFH